MYLIGIPSRSALVVLVAWLFAFGVAQAQHADHGGNRSRNDHPELTPPDFLSFMPNRGQVIDDKENVRRDVLYKAQASGVTLYVFADRISYVFETMVGDIEAVKRCDFDPHHPAVKAAYRKGHRVDLDLIGASRSPTVLEGEEADGYTNFYLGHCPDGILNVPSYRTLVVQGVYPRIDMVLRGSGGGVKCDFIVHPGGNPADIRMRYTGGEAPRIVEGGGLRVENSVGFIAEDAPYSYQPNSPYGALPYYVPDGTEQRVESRWVVEGSDVRFAIGAYDRSRVLVIDPTRKWATYYGGNGTEFILGSDVTEVDRSGNVLIVGGTSLGAFPTSTGAYQTGIAGGMDMFIVKMKYDGTRLWATLYGGGGATSGDLAHAVATDEYRNVLVGGHTESLGFPTLNAHQGSNGGNAFNPRDAVVIKLDSSGARRWATYYGGASMDDGYGFAIDSSASPAMVGYTQSGTNIATSGGFDNSINGTSDGFLVKFDSGGVRQWGTYYGGTGFECSWAAATDSRDNITIAGWTNSTNLPTSTGAFQSGYSANFDGFVAQFNSNGTRRWATYYGNTGWDYVDVNNNNPTNGYGALASDGEGNIFYAGSTSSGTFPVTTGVVQTTFGGGSYDATVVKFDTSGTRVWATFHGGAGTDRAHGVASNNSGGVLLCGETTSANMPVTADAYNFANSGGTDAFVAKISATGTIRQFSTYYGGGGSDIAEGISFDPFGSIVFGGETGSNPFPVTAAAFQVTYGGNTDGFLSLFCDIEGSVIDTSGPTTFCQGDSVVLSVPLGYASYLWSTGETDTSIVVKTPGTYWVELANGAGCLARSDTIRVRWFDKPSPVFSPATNPIRLCAGDSVRLDVGPRNFRAYYWYSDAALTTLIRSGIGPAYRNLVVRNSGTFRVIVEDTTGCLDTTATMQVQVLAKPDTISISPLTLEFCEGTNGLLTASRSAIPGESFIWLGGSNPGGGRTFTPDRTGTYQLRVLNANGCFVLSNTVSVVVHRRVAPPIFTSTPTICEGDTARLDTRTDYLSYRWSTGDTLPFTRVWQNGTVTLTVTDSNGCEQVATRDITVVPRPAPRLFVRPNDGIICEGDTAFLDAGFGYAEYIWSTGERSQTIAVRDSGLYWCQVRSTLALCYGNSDTVRISLKPKPRGQISGPLAACVGTLSNYVFPRLTGATYQWTVTGGGGGAITSGAGTDSIGVQWGATAGTATLRVVVTGSNGCVLDTSISIDVGANLVPSITSNRPLNLCPGDSVTLDAGSGYDSYEWLNPQGGTIGGNRSITVLDSGVYRVRVRRGTCSGESPVTVRRVDPPVPVITIVAGDTVICPGGTAILDAGPYRSFQWSPASAGTGRRIVVSDSGVYQVQVIDSNGCVGVSAAVRIRIANPPKPVITGLTSACVNSTVTYSIPDQPGSSYNWIVAGGIGTIVTGQGTNSITVNWTAAGNGVITVEQTSSVTRCTGTSDPLFVTVSNQLSPTITTSGPTTICDGDSLTLRGPSGFTTYMWTDAGGNPLGTDDSLVVRTAGTYTLQVASGPCSGSASIDITLKPPVIATISPSGPAAICEGDSLLLQAAPGFVRYLWSTGDTTESILVKVAGTYTVTVFDVDGCQGTSPATDVTVNPLPNATLTSSGDTLIASGGTVYRWFRDGVLIPNETGDRLVARENGSFSVDVIDANGCWVVAGPIDIAAGALATITIGTFRASPGQRFDVPIQLSDAVNLDRNGIRNFSASLRFNRTLLVPIDPGVSVTDAGDDRIVTINGTIPASAVTGGAIATVGFIAALGDRDRTPLAIEAFGWVEGAVTTTTVDGLFELTGLCVDGGTRLINASGQTVLRPVRPNPVSGSAEIEYEVVEDGRTRIYLVDMTGRRIPLVDALVTAGRYVATFNVAALNSGSYVCVMETPTEQLRTMMRIEK